MGLVFARLSHASWASYSVVAGVFLIYFATRFYGLSIYPAYFFCDEAIQTVLARDLLQNGFKLEGEFFPTFFRNWPYYNLGTSVYAQVPVAFLGERSIFVTRSISVLYGSLTALAVFLISSRVFQLRSAPFSVLILSLIPTWFLHSRTAFETVMAVGFYSVALYFSLSFLKFRRESSLYWGIFFASLAFYSYRPMQLVVGLHALALVLLLKFLVRPGRRVWWTCVGLATVTAAPAIRFQLSHPHEALHHLELLSSHWSVAHSFADAVHRSLMSYLSALDPTYWFAVRDSELSRHLFRDGPHVPIWLAIPIVVGLVRSLKRWRAPEYMMLIGSMLLAPSSGLLVEPGITRVLGMVVPLVVLGTVGLEVLLSVDFLQRGRRMISMLLFAVGATFSGVLLYLAVHEEPYREQDYGLYGIQLGAKELFVSSLPGLLKEYPHAEFRVSPSWANGVETLKRFFMDEESRVVVAGPGEYFTFVRPIPDHALFVITPGEWAQVQESKKFNVNDPIRVITAPNGSPIFYVVKLTYAENVQEIFDQESASRRVLREGAVSFGGEVWNLKHSMLDLGSISHLFDGEVTTLVRTFEANPFQLLVTFPSSREISTVTLTTGSMERLLVDIDLLAEEGEVVRTISEQFTDLPPDPTVSMRIPAGTSVASIRIKVGEGTKSEPANIHVREISFTFGSPSSESPDVSLSSRHE